MLLLFLPKGGSHASSVVNPTQANPHDLANVLEDMCCETVSKVIDQPQDYVRSIIRGKTMDDGALRLVTECFDRYEAEHEERVKGKH